MKSTVIPMSGPAVKSHIWPRMGKGFCARQKSSCLLSQDCLQAQAQARVRLPHRSHRTHRVLLRVQRDYELTILIIKRRETEEIIPKSKNKNQNGDNIEASGRSSQMISKMQKCQHSQTRKWHPGSTVFILTSQKTENCEVCKRTKITRAPCRERAGGVVPRAKKKSVT